MSHLSKLDRIRAELLSAESKLQSMRKKKPHYEGALARDVEDLSRLLAREEAQSLKAALESQNATPKRPAR